MFRSAVSPTGCAVSTTHTSTALACANPRACARCSICIPSTSCYSTGVEATASGFSDACQHVNEEVLISYSRQGGSVNPLVWADKVVLGYPGGGAVFSPGSIVWCGPLSWNEYDNTVSHVTANVLERFLDDPLL